MKYFILLLLFPLFTFCGQQKKENQDKKPETTQETETTVQNATYYLIRHAEKDRSHPKDPDPGLTIEGMKRAQRWAAYFEPIQTDAIYTTKYIRTKQTISMIAQQKNIIPTTYWAHHLYSDEFLKETNGKTTLIVGHSNTLPELVNKLIGEKKYTDMDDLDHGTLFKVSIHGNDKKAETIHVE